MSRRKGKRIKVERRRRPGAPVWEEREMVVVTVAGSNPPCAVSFWVGGDVIWIRSNEQHFPKVPVSGLGNIAGLRDALAEICNLMGAA